MHTHTHTQMTAMNLAVVFGPNLLYSLDPGSYEEAGHVNTVVKKLIEGIFSLPLSFVVVI